MSVVSGSFQAGAQPHLTALVEIPRLQVQHTVDFVVDTGASRTTLHPVTIQSMGLTWQSYAHRNAPPNSELLSGILGGASYGREDAILHLGPRSLDCYILMGPLKKKLYTDSLQASIPSLLGMDILQQLRLVMDYRNAEISLTLP